MSEENELNESEMDQLLRELEQKSNSKSNAPRSADTPEKKTKTPVKTEKVSKKHRKAELPKEKPKASEIAETPKSTEKPKANGVSVVQRGSSESLNRKVSIFLFLLTTPLLLTAVWMLGNYLASFISVGWLIAIVSFVGVLGLSYFFKRLVGKGRFMIWSGLISLLLLIAMLLPATAASTKMIEFGHWPVSSLTEASGMKSENVFVSFSSRISKALADFRFGFATGDPIVSFPKELGKELPLVPEIITEEPKTEDNEEPKGEDEKVEDKEEKEPKKAADTTSN